MNYIYKRVIFFSVFLNLLTVSNSAYSQGSGYEVGTNTITRDIYFRLEVQDSLLVVPESVSLDFGDILKGSTDTKQAETKIKVEAGADVKNVKASYESITEEIQRDGSRKIQIKYVEENKPEKESINGLLKIADTKEKDTIDVYMLPFEKNYELTMISDKNQVDIPVKGEIRGVGDAKLGKYEGNIRVQIEVVTKNIEEEGR